MLPRSVIILFQSASGRIVVAFSLLVVVGLIQGAGLLLILPFLNLVGVGENRNPPAAIEWIISIADEVGISWTLGNVLFGFVVAVLVMALLKWWQAVHSSNLIKQITGEFQKRFYCLWLFQPWITSSRYSGGDIFNFMQRDIGQLSLFLNQGLLLVSSTLLTFVYCVVALQLSASLTLLATGVGLILFFAFIPLRRKVSALSESLRQRFKIQFDLITEHLAGLKLIKAFAREPREYQFLVESTTVVQSDMHRINVVQATSRAFQGIIAAVILAAVVFVAIVYFSLDPAKLILLVFIFSRLLPLMIQIQEVWQGILITLPSVRAISELTLRASPEVLPDEAFEPILLKSEISGRNLSFTWPGNSEPVFKGFSFTIPVKKITVITGESGTGKSTLSQLILGIIAPDVGETLIDGEPLPESWKSHVGYVPQENFLFSQSIRENLLWGNPKATEADLWEVLKSVAASEFVKKLPNGIDAVVSSKGDSLSGGECQRIAIARALARNPAVLILDEPTSALDLENESILRDLLYEQKFERTVVVVSHRESLIEAADHVIRIS